MKTARHAESRSGAQGLATEGRAQNWRPREGGRRVRWLAAGVRLPTRAPGSAGLLYVNGTSGCDTLMVGWLKPKSGAGELAHPAAGSPPKDAKLCFDSTGFDAGPISFFDPTCINAPYAQRESNSQSLQCSPRARARC